MSRRLFRTSQISLRTLKHVQISVAVVLFVVLASLFVGLFNTYTRVRVSAAPNNTVNYQARILQINGAVVADGAYNVEFKLYDVSSGGTALWTETYTGGNKIVTKNGYVTTALGSITSFPGTIPWDQELWVTLNIGGTGAPAWDGEMNPRMKITAVPYAYSAAKLQTTSGANTSTLSILAPTVGNQVFQLQDQGAAGTYNICIQNSASCGFATLSGTNNFTGANTFSAAGTGLAVTNNATIGGTLVVTGLGTFNGGLTVGAGTQLTNSGATLNTAMAISDLPTGGNIGTAAATVDVATNFNVNQTTSGPQAITLPTPTSGTAGRVVYVNNVGSQTFSMYGFTISSNGNASFMWNGSAWVLVGNVGSSGLYIQNQNSIQQATSNYWISGTGRADTSFTTPLLDTATAVALNIGTTNATAINLNKNTLVAGNLTQSGATTFSTGTGTVSLNGATTAGSTFTSTGLGTFNGGLTVATGYTFTNGSSTLNTASALGDLAAGPLGTAATTVDVITSFTIAPTAGGRTYTIPSPTVTTAGRIIYISNISGSNSFTIGGNIIGTGTNVGYIWNGSAWAPTGVTGVTTIGTIDSQTKSANGAVISGANIYLQTADATNVGLVSIGAQTFAGAKTFSSLLTATGLTVAANSVFTNNGATLNTALAVANDSDGGGLGGTPGTPLTAAQSVDIYTSFTINQTTASQTITLPSPTNTAAGRTIYISNIGTQTFTMGGFTIAPAGTAQFVWNGSAWTLNGNVGSSGAYIQNQNAVQQATSNYWISGTGRADTSFTTPLIDTPTAVVLNIGTTNATQINLNKNTQVTGNITFADGAARTISVNTQTTSNTAGNNLTVQSATGNGTGAGGALTVQAGSSGSGATGNGGTLNLYGGTAVSTNGNGGAVSILTGAGVGTGQSGALTLSTPTSEISGAITIATGTAASAGGSAGTFTVNGGAALGSGNGGSLALNGGDSVAGNGGSITLRSGTGVSSAASGQIIARPSASGGNRVDLFQVQNGAGTAILNVDTINSRVGIATGATAPSYDLSFGGTANRIIRIETQATSNTAGANLTLQSATGNGTGAGGIITIQGGSAGATGTGGQTSIVGGFGGGTSGAGGALFISGGYALGGNSNGGTVTITGGALQGTGTGGQVIIKPVASNDRANFFQIQNGAGTSILNVDTNTAAISFAGATSVSSSNTLTVGTGLTSLGGGLNVTAGNTTLTADLTVNGNTTIGNATTDRLTVTSQLLGASPLVFQGATDNGFTSTFTFTEPTANNIITFPNASGTVQLSPGSGSYLLQVPTTNADNTITPTANSVTGLTVNGTSGTAATAASILQGGAALGLNITSSSTGDGQNINLTNTSGTQTNGLAITRNGGGGTTTNLLNLTNTAGTATNAINISGTYTNLINNANFTVTNAGAVTAGGDYTFLTGANRTISIQTQTTSNTAGNALTVNAAIGNGTGAGGALSLAGGQSGSGATGNGGAASLTGGLAFSTAGTGGAAIVRGGDSFNASGNAGSVTIQGGQAWGTGASGSVTISNGAAGGGAQGQVIIKPSTSADRATFFQIQNAAGTSIVNVDTNTSAIALQANTTVSGANTLTVGTGLTSLGGGLSVTLGTTTLSGDLLSNGNTTIGNATTDRLTVTSQLLGASPLVFQGATDNGFATTFTFTEPTANNIITFPNASGTVQLSPAGSGFGLVQVPTSNTAGVNGANVIAPTAASIVGLTVKGTTGTAANVMEIFNSSATPTLQAYFNSAGSLNVSQLIQPTANNTIDLGLTATAFRTGYFGTSVVTPLVDTNSAVALNIGTTNATQINLNKNTQVTGNISFPTGGNRTISLGTQSTSNTAGNNLTVTAAAGNGTANGGVLSLYGGQGGATGGGGALNLSGGGAAGGNSAGGDTSIGSGSSAGSGNAGTIALQGGAADLTGAGGAITITGGTGGTTSGAGGSIAVSGGAATGTNSNGGNITVTAGTKTGSGTSGQVVIKPAASNDRATFFQVQNAAATAILSIDTNTAALNFAGATSVTGTNTLTVGTGLTSLGGGLSVTAGNTTLTADLIVNGNTTIGNATTDRLTVTSQILGGTPLAFQGATDNGFATSFLFTEPTANNSITFPDASGTVLLSVAGSGGAIVQVPSSTAINTISPTANSVVGLKVNGTTGTATNAVQINTLTTADALGQLVVSTGAAANKGLIVQGVASQTGNLQEWQSSTGTVFSRITSTGELVIPRIYLGSSGLTNQSAGVNSALFTNTTGTLINRDIADANTVLTVRQVNAGSTGALFALQNSGGTNLSGFNISGNLFYSNSGFTSTLGSATLTANRTLNLPDADGTLLVSAAGSGYGLVQVPTSNTAGASGANVISPTANSIVGLIVNGTTGTATNAVQINTLTTADTTAQLAVSTGGTAKKGIIVQAVASQTADLLQFQDSIGNVLSKFTSIGALRQDYSSGASLLLDTASTINNQFQGSAGGKVVLVSKGSSVSAQTADLFQLQNSAGSVLSYFNANGDLSVGGTAAASSTTALAVKNNAGTTVLGINTTNGTATFQAGTDTATLGSELHTPVDFTSGANWTSTGWTTATTTATHTTGNTSVLQNNSVAIVASNRYQVSFDLSGTCGAASDGLLVTLGGAQNPTYGGGTYVNGTLCPGTFTYGFTATNTNKLAFTPTTNWNGTISNVSIKQITGTSNAALEVKNASGTVNLQVRASNSATNSFIGLDVGKYNTNGYNNTGSGSYALQSNTTGYANTATGYTSLYSNTTGYSNTATGNRSLYSNTSGVDNTATGNNSLQLNTTGFLNTATGSLSLANNTTGSSNSAFGYATLYAHTTGVSNTAIGDSALGVNTTGSYNTGLGSYAGNSSGQFLTLNNLSRATALGANAQVFQSDTIALGGQNTNTKVGIGTGLPTNQLSAEANRYSTGTVTTNATTTVTGNGTTFTSAMVGNVIYIATNSATTAPYLRTITGFTNATTITVSSAVPTLTAAQYYINYVGLQVSTGGNVGINSLTPANQLSVNNLTTADSLAQVAISTGATTNKGLVIQGVASQTADLFQLQTSAGAPVLRASAIGSFGVGTGISAGDYDADGELSIYGAGGFARIGVGSNGSILSNANQFQFTSASNRPTYFRNNNAANTVVNILGFGSQTASLLDLRNNSDVVLSSFDASGQLILGNDTATPQAGSITFNDATASNTFSSVLNTTALTASRTLSLPDASGTLLVSVAGSGSAIVQVPSSTAVNTITPTAASVVGLTVNGTSGTATTAAIINQTQAADGLQVATTNGSGTQTNGVLISRNGAGTTTNLLNLTNTAGTATNGLNFTGTFGNLINSTNFTVSNAGAIVGVGVNSGTGLLQGTGGLTLTGTTAVNTTGTASTSIGNATGTLTLTGATTLAGTFSQTGATTFGTGTGAVSLNGATSVTGTNTLTVGTGLTSLGGGLSVTAGNTTLTADLTVNGNTTIGNATTDRLTVTSQILGASPLVFQGATDNGFATTFTFTEPTANNSITFPDASGTVLLSVAGSGGAIVQVPSSTAVNTISPTAASVVGLTVNGTSGTATTALAVSQPGAAAGVTIASANNTATNGLSFSGTFTNLINATNFSVTNAGALTTASTINTNTFSATALTFSGANPIVTASTAATGLTVQAPTTGTLTLNTVGAGTVNVGTTNSTAVSVGSATSANTTIAGTVINLNTATLQRTAAGTTALNLSDGANTTLAIQNSGAGVANLTVDGSITGVGVNATTGLLQGQLGLTITGAAASINDSSNFATTINTGTSTGAVTIGNATNAANTVTIVAGATNGINLNSTKIESNAATLGLFTTPTTVNVFTAATAINAGAAAGIATFGNGGAFTLRSTTGQLTVQSGSGTLSLGTSTALTASAGLAITSGGATVASIDAGGAAALNLGITNANALSVSRTGITTTINGVLTVAEAANFNGNTTIGNATTDRLTVTSQILGGTPLAFQGATDNGFATSFLFTEPTANNSITFPDASGTVLLSVAGSGGAIVQVPSSTAINTISPTANSVVGLKVNGTTGTATNAVQINTLTTADASGQLVVSTGAVGNEGIIVQGVASQTADLFQLQTSAGAAVLRASAIGSFGVGTAIVAGDYDADGEFSVKGAGGFARIGVGSNGSILSNASQFQFISTSGTPTYFMNNNAANTVVNIQGFASQSANLLDLRNNSNVVLSSFNFNGDLNVGGAGSAGSTTALRVQTAAAADTAFTVDTTNNRVKIGNDTGTGTATTLLTLDTATTAPTGVNGSMYYDSTIGRVQCYEAGVWANCGSNTSLQQTYNASTGGTTPEIIVDATRRGIDIQDVTAGTLGATEGLFNVRGVATASTFGASLFTVQGNGRVGINNGSTSTTPAVSFDLSFGQIAGATTARTIGVEAQTTAATGGNGLTVSSGAGNTSGAGGLLTVQSGAGGATGAGGALTVQGGTGGATSGAGGLVTIQGGNATAGASNGGGVSILAGASTTTGVAGAITVTSGAGVAGSNTAGGAITVTSGAGGGSAAGGTLQVLGGQGGATGAGGALTVRAGAGGATSGTGGALTLQGGSGTASAANGGNLNLVGGINGATGYKGLVVADTFALSTAGAQNCASTPCTITQSNIDSYGALLITASGNGYTVNLGDPSLGASAAGRLIYITNTDTTDDFVLTTNGGADTINLKPNTTATMIWNGADWTAAGASSSTDLQAAYDNTAASAGGAELILSSAGTGGLTVRNDATTPIIGGLLEVQTSIGSNLFSVSNNATEYANNGGAENATFTMWAAAPAGGSVSRYTTAGTNIATGAASTFVDATSTANTGAKNTLTTTLTQNLKYKVSYTVRHTSTTAAFTTLDTIYSSDGTATTQTCASGSVINNASWTRIDCSFTATAVGASNAIIIRHSDAVDHDFYIDNLSVTVSADVNHAVDGSVDVALGTNWQTYDADGGAGTSTLARDTTNIYDTSGAVSDVTTAHVNEGMRNNMSITPSINTQYLVTFYAKLLAGTFTNLTVGFLPAGGSGTPAAAQLCTDYNTQTLTTTGWTKVTCIITTPGSGISDPDLVIYQPTAVARTFYVDALSITLNTNNSSNVQIGGGQKGGPTTLFTLDRSNGPPIAANNDAYLGSMYYDTSSGRIQCYEADGWGACGAAPDNIVNLNPEYSGAVLNGSGVGTMTADFCSNQSGVLDVNTGLCATGQAKNFYKWTSPQATEQTYSIYVTYQLPATFNGFSSDDTVQLVARTDSTSNAAVTYEMYKSTGSAVTQCGTGETTVVTSANTWQSVGVNGNESTGCSFTSASAGNFVIFKINVKAKSSANAYIGTLSFTTTGR